MLKEEIQHHTIILVGRAAPKVMKKYFRTIKKIQWLFVVIVNDVLLKIQVKVLKALKKHSSSLWSAMI